MFVFRKSSSGGSSQTCCPRVSPLPQRFDDFYFLTDPEEFIYTHFPDEERWQLLDAPVSLEEFEKRVFKTSAFFALGLRLIHPHHAHMVTGRPSHVATLPVDRLNLTLTPPLVSLRRRRGKRFPRFPQARNVHP